MVKALCYFTFKCWQYLYHHVIFNKYHTELRTPKIAFHHFRNLVFAENLGFHDSTFRAAQVG